MILWYLQYLPALSYNKYIYTKFIINSCKAAHGPGSAPALTSSPKGYKNLSGLPGTEMGRTVKRNNELMLAKYIKEGEKVFYNYTRENKYLNICRAINK